MQTRLTGHRVQKRLRGRRMVVMALLTTVLRMQQLLQTAQHTPEPQQLPKEQHTVRRQPRSPRERMPHSQELRQAVVRRRALQGLPLVACTWIRL